jgi:hypothetical protein
MTHAARQIGLIEKSLISFMPGCVTQFLAYFFVAAMVGNKEIP